MKFIKVILTLLAIMFGVMAVFWLLGIVWTLFGYAFWFGVVAAIGYGGYKLFKKVENKTLSSGTAFPEIEDRDYSLSWEEYNRKYLKK